MDAVHTSETSVYNNEITRRNIPEGPNLHTRRRENLKSHRLDICLYEHKLGDFGDMDRHDQCLRVHLTLSVQSLCFAYLCNLHASACSGRNTCINDRGKINPRHWPTCKTRETGRAVHVIHHMILQVWNRNNKDLSSVPQDLCYTLTPLVIVSHISQSHWPQPRHVTRTGTP
jgi:hypothetical protein